MLDFREGACIFRRHVESPFVASFSPLLFRERMPMNRVSMVVVVGVVLVFAGMITVADAATPVVPNVQANQRDGTTGAGTIVDITYDVQADSATVGITIEVSNDGGATFDVSARTFTGDVGIVEVGTGKSVEWQAGVDVPGEYWDNCQVKVTAHDREIEVSLPGGATMWMVWIEPGTFAMGSPDTEPGRVLDEGPQHEVTITRGFYLGKYEVTEGQWVSVMGGTATNPTLPKVNISWDDVQAFIAALAAQGLTGFRFPTEAEWEYACRSGTTTRWSFGDDENQVGLYAWCDTNSGHQAHEVGTKLPNPWGLYGMHGNVWEWVQDWHGSYSSDSQTDPTGPSTGSNRVYRGGSFLNPAQYVRSAYRSGNNPGARYYVFGARLLRQIP